MKRYHKRFLALCLSASMLVSPLSYTRAYASEETSITENSSQNETVAESENKSESQSPAAEEAGSHHPSSERFHSLPGRTEDAHDTL